MGITGTWEGYTSSPLYIYNQGTWNGVSSNNVTMTKGWQINSMGTYIDIRTNNSNLETIGRLNSTINLTSYIYLKINMAGTSYSASYGDKIFTGISTNSNITTRTSLTSNITLKVNQDKATIILNISSYSGNYFIYFGNNQATSGYAGTVYIYQIILSTT